MCLTVCLCTARHIAVDSRSFGPPPLSGHGRGRAFAPHSSWPPQWPLVLSSLPFGRGGGRAYYRVLGSLALPCARRGRPVWTRSGHWGLGSLCVCVWSCSGLCGSMPRSARAHMHVTERACLYYCILSAARYKRERAHPPLPFLPVLEYARRKKYVQGDSTQHGPVPLRGRNFVLLFSATASATGTALGRCV